MNSIALIFTRLHLSMLLIECQTARSLDNLPQMTHPRSSDLVVDKRTKNNLFSSG